MGDSEIVSLHISEKCEPGTHRAGYNLHTIHTYRRRKALAEAVGLAVDQGSKSSRHLTSVHIGSVVDHLTMEGNIYIGTYDE
jgi:hypothetical protein